MTVARRRGVAQRVPERVVQQHIRRLLAMVGAIVYVLGTVRRRGDHPGTMQTPGLPDLFAWVPADRSPGKGQLYIPLWIEVKADGGRLRPAQVSFRDQCAQGGVDYIVGGLAEVEWYLQARGLIRGSARVGC